MSDSEPPAPADRPRDVAVIVGTSEDGTKARIVRARDGRVELGELRAPEEGKPMYGELVKLNPRADSPVCDVEVLHTPPTTAASATSTKPAQVATDTYRANWDRVFGDKKLN
jgi:hypothetical protein